MSDLGGDGTKYDAMGHIVQRGPFNPADLDENGDFIVDKFIARLQEKHREWLQR
jgi:hypothetical protein